MMSKGVSSVDTFEARNVTYTLEVHGQFSGDSYVTISVGGFLCYYKPIA